MNSAILFTISQSWHQAPWLHERLGFASAGDAILLQGEAVLALHSPLSLASFVAKCEASDIKLYALQADCEIHGVDNQYMSVSMVNYSDYVDLVIQNAKQVAW